MHVLICVAPTSHSHDHLLLSFLSSADQIPQLRTFYQHSTRFVWVRTEHLFLEKTEYKPVLRTPVSAYVTRPQKTMLVSQSSFTELSVHRKRMAYWGLGKWDRKWQPRPASLFTQLLNSGAANKRWPDINVLVERALLTIICHKQLSVTKHYLSQTVICHKPYLSQTVICHKQLSVTNCYLLQTIICHKPLSVTNYYLSQIIICHEPLSVTNKCWRWNTLAPGRMFKATEVWVWHVVSQGVSLTCCSEWRCEFDML